MIAQVVAVTTIAYRKHDSTIPASVILVACFLNFLHIFSLKLESADFPD